MFSHSCDIRLFVCLFRWLQTAKQRLYKKEEKKKEKEKEEEEGKRKHHRSHKKSKKRKRSRSRSVSGQTDRHLGTVYFDPSNEATCSPQCALCRSSSPD